MALFTKKQKVFCIGRNKTGTTSLEKVLSNFGYRMGDQPTGEMLLKYYAVGNFKPIIKFCNTAQAFQDAPFSWPYTWLHLHAAYPDAKFILTIRDAEAWYESITSFHSKLIAENKRIPTKEDLMAADYLYSGFMWDANRAVYKTPVDDPYNKECMIANFQRHNEDVTHYFKDKGNFIAINVSNSEDYQRLCKFLGKESVANDFPHLNKT